MRQPDVMRPIRLHTTLPEDIRVKLDLHLYSELEARIPKGAYQKFFLERIREFFDTRTFDLGKALNLSGPAIVRGSPATISLLEKILGGSNDAQS